MNKLTTGSCMPIKCFHAPSLYPLFFTSSTFSTFSGFGNLPPEPDIQLLPLFLHLLKHQVKRISMCRVHKLKDVWHSLREGSRLTTVTTRRQ